MRIYFYFYQALERLAFSEHFTSFSSVEEQYSKPSIWEEINPCNNHRWGFVWAGRCFAAKSPGVPLCPKIPVALEAAEATSSTDRGLGELEIIQCCLVQWMPDSPSAILGLSRPGQDCQDVCWHLNRGWHTWVSWTSIKEELRGDPTVNSEPAAWRLQTPLPDLQ